jgi:hypothetical protein
VPIVYRNENIRITPCLHGKIKFPLLLVKLADSKFLTAFDGLFADLLFNPNPA